MATRRKIHKETIYMFEQKVKHVIEKKAWLQIPNTTLHKDQLKQNLFLTNLTCYKKNLTMLTLAKIHISSFPHEALNFNF